MSNYCRKHKTSHFKGCRHCKIDDQQATITTQAAAIEALREALTYLSTGDTPWIDGYHHEAWECMAEYAKRTLALLDTSKGEQ